MKLVLLVLFFERMKLVISLINKKVTASNFIWLYVWPVSTIYTENIKKYFQGVEEETNGMK